MMLNRCEASQCSDGSSNNKGQRDETRPARSDSSKAVFPPKDFAADDAAPAITSVMIGKKILFSTKT
jgi:hypothetical protein